MDGATKPQRPGGNPALAVSAVMLLTILFLLAVTLLPSWRGGFFIRVVLIGAVGLLAVDLFRQRQPTRRPPAAEAPPGQDGADDLSGGGAPGWDQIVMYGAISLSFFLIVFLFGIYLGPALFLAGLLRYISRSGWLFTLAFAVAAGMLLPFLFARMLTMHLWPGVIPEIIPGWLGGGLLPPI